MGLFTSRASRAASSGGARHAPASAAAAEFVPWSGGPGRKSRARRRSIAFICAMCFASARMTDVSLTTSALDSNDVSTVQAIVDEYREFVRPPDQAISQVAVQLVPPQATRLLVDVPPLPVG